MDKWGITILRLAMGLTFALHGGQKLFVYGIEGVTGAMAGLGLPLPAVSALLVTAAELGGGLALLMGLYTRLAAIPLAFTMLVALVAVHLKQGFFLPNGFEYTFVLLAASIALAFTGPGALALDTLLERRLDDSDSVRQGTRPRESRVA